MLTSGLLSWVRSSRRHLVIWFNDLKRDVRELATRQDVFATRLDLKDSEQRITMRLGGLIVGATAVLAVLMRLL